MANAYTGTTNAFSTPYLTLAEYKSAPTSIDIDNLVFNSQDPDVQDAELANVIARASSWIDTFCNQVLAATTEQEQQRTRYSGDGSIRLHPRYNPIIALTSFQYGYPNNLATLGDCSVAWLEEQEIIVPNATLGNWTSQGPLSFGAFGGGYANEVFVKYSYVTGYTNTVIVTAVAAASTLTVANGTGITPGQMLKIYDGMYSENVTVASTYTFGSTTVPLVTPLIYSHDPGASISALPPAVKEAAILVTTAFLKTRGDSSMSMLVTTTPGTSLPNADKVGQEIALSMQLLQPYRRVR
jgi:hypothetical protein